MLKYAEAAEVPDSTTGGCFEIEVVGQATLSWARAGLVATGHISFHVSVGDREILEDMKATMMPPELLTIYQPARKRAIEERS